MTIKGVCVSLPRFYSEIKLPKSGSAILQLPKEEMHHLHVLRISEGEHIAIFDSYGTSLEFTVQSIEKSSISGEILQELPSEKMPRLTLVQGISKGERMTQTIRQTTEIGVQRIIPFLSERCIVRLAKNERSKKGDRFRSIAFSAAKQCGRSFLPQIDDPLEIEELLQILQDFDRIILAWEEKSKSGMDITGALNGCNIDTNVALLIGPEGGFSEAEVEQITNSCGDKLKTISLGDLILRTETAAVVASALCLHELGALGRRA